MTPQEETQRRTDFHRGRAEETERFRVYDFAPLPEIRPTLHRPLAEFWAKIEADNLADRDWWHTPLK